MNARFTAAVNQMPDGRDAFAVCEQGMALTLHSIKPEALQQKLLDEMEVLKRMLRQMILQDATVAQDLTEYSQRFDSIIEKFSNNAEKPFTSELRPHLQHMDADLLRIVIQTSADDAKAVRCQYPAMKLVS